MLDVRVAQLVIENTLRDTILYALSKRLTPVASIAALRTVLTQSFSMPEQDDDTLIAVTTNPVQSFRWSTVSTAADNGTSVIRPNDVPGSQNGRWLSWASPIRFSPTVGGNDATLDQITASGPLQRVLIVDGKFSIDEFIQLATAQTPSVLIEPIGDTPEDTALPGWRWQTRYRFRIHVVTQNLRDRREALQGSVVSADPDMGGYAIEGFIRALISGVQLNAVVDAVMNVIAGPADIWDSELAQRSVVKSREYTVVVVEENPNAPNDYGAVQDLRGTPHLEQLDAAADVWDPNNYVTAGCLVAYPAAGLTQAVTAGTAQIAGSTVTYAGQNFTFTAWSDTYRDLLPNGAMTFVTVPQAAPAPAITATALRIGITRTNGTGIVSDILLAQSQSFNWPQNDFGAI